MTEVEYALLPTDSLHEHEEVEPARVEEVLEEIRSRGTLDEPVLVARGSLVILNGHHRFAALRALGARRVPVFLIDYHNGSVRLDRWSPGPPLSKEDVLRTVREGRRYPPKTTRHILSIDLPRRPTRLEELLRPAPRVGPRGRQKAPS